MVPAAGALAALMGGAASRQRGEPPLTVSAIRFYQPASGTTTIEGVCEFRLAALWPGVAPVMRYRVEVGVLDSAGLELHRASWSRELPATAVPARGATSVESFSFAAAPGRYRVRVRGVPESGEVVEREVGVTAYGARPPISDLLLATGVRHAGSDSEATGPGEIRRAGYVLRTAPTPRLGATEAVLTYYAEVYPWPGAASSGELGVAVVTAGGRQVIRTAPRAVQVEPTGALTRGSVDLTGLPAGDYRLKLEVRLGDSAVAAEAPFAVSAPAPVAPAAVEATEAGDRFAQASEERLDSLYAPLVYLLDPRSEEGVYARLSVEGKRGFLRDFWRRRDPSPGTPDNPAMTDFYRGVGYANEAFREGGAAQIPGWRTDRGRIYLKHGRPDEVLRRPLASPRAYEAWKYTRGRHRYYVFYDQSGLGHYALIGTNDRRETGLVDWERYLGYESAQEVLRFLGIESAIRSNNRQ